MRLMAARGYDSGKLQEDCDSGMDTTQSGVVLHAQQSMRSRWLTGMACRWWIMIFTIFECDENSCVLADDTLHNCNSACLHWLDS